MRFAVGQVLEWAPYCEHGKRTEVTVVELRKRGAAKLSNGWVVDEDGIAEGTSRQPGGFVVEIPFARQA